jgi:hypothetical protein
VRDSVESRLRPYRQRAWEGHLDTEDFRDLLHAFLAFKADFRRDMDALDAYAMINCCAALLAQMLFTEYVPRNIFGIMWPFVLCGASTVSH